MAGPWLVSGWCPDAEDRRRRQKTGSRRRMPKTEDRRPETDAAGGPVAGCRWLGPGYGNKKRRPIMSRLLSAYNFILHYHNMH